MQDTLGLPRRYEVIEELGRTEGSCVVSAMDIIINNLRALKVALRSGYLKRFRHEYLRLCEFRHPNIVRAYDFGMTQFGRPFFSETLVRGIPLSHWPERQNINALASLTLQILDALAMIHARGWVHRDLKPINLLVVGEGSGALVRLLDFGLVAPLGTDTHSAGTLPYVAPEIARGEKFDGRADLFSLGMILYEALAPQYIPRTLDEVRQQWTNGLKPLAQVQPQVPIQFSDFVSQLLCQNPHQRWAHAWKAIDALTKLSGIRLYHGPERSAAERMLRVSAVSHRPNVVRRIKRLMIQSKKSQRGSLVFLVAPAGVGKSPVIRELEANINLSGFRVIKLAFTADSESFLLNLNRITFALNINHASQPNQMVADFKQNTIHQTNSMARQLAERLMHGLGTEPTALLLDDVPWNETIYSNILFYLAEQIAHVPVVIVITIEESLPVQEILKRKDTHVHIETLLPLTKTQIAALIRHRLKGLELPKPALERLRNDSQGMPTLVERTLAKLFANKVVCPTRTGFEFMGGRYEVGKYRDRELLTERLAHIEPSHQPVLKVAAILEPPLDASLVAKVAQTDLYETAQTLADLARLDILIPQENANVPNYAFVKKNIRAEVYQNISTLERQQLHDRAAAVLESSLPQRSQQWLKHVLKGSDAQRAVHEAVRAGDQAANLFSDRQAIDLFSQAYARLSDVQSHQAAVIAARLGYLCQRHGQLEQAARWLKIAQQCKGADQSTVLEATLYAGYVAIKQGLRSQSAWYAQQALRLAAQQPAPLHQGLAERLAGLAIQSKNITQAWEHLLLAKKIFSTNKIQSELIATLLDLARLAKQRGQLGRAVMLARQALANAKQLGDTASMAEAYAFLGRGFAQAARFDAAERSLKRGLLLAKANHDLFRESFGLRELGNVCIRQGQGKKAINYYQQSLELARLCQARSAESAALHNLGVQHGRCGEFNAALAAFRASLDIAHDMDDQVGAAMTSVEFGQVFFWLGNWPQAQEMLEFAAHMSQQCHEQVTQSEAQALIAWVKLKSGESALASVFINETDQLVAKLEDPADRCFILLQAIRCALQLQERVKAQAWAKQLAHEIQQGHLVDLEPFEFLLPGHLAVGLGDRDTAKTMFGKAIQSSQRLGYPLIEIEAHITLAELQPATLEATEHLTQAMEKLRLVTMDLSPDLIKCFLAQVEFQNLHRLFQLEYQRYF